MRGLLILCLLLVVPWMAMAVDYQGSCSIDFQATSTLHDFSGKGRCEPFTVNETIGILTVPTLNVAVSGMDTGNEKRDKQMYKMFNVEEYPLITGFTGAVMIDDIRTMLKESADSAPEVRFFLKVRDIEKEVTAKLQNVVENGPAITADLVFSLSLEEYKLKPPSVLGIIRVGDKVDVTASFSLNAL